MSLHLDRFVRSLHPSIQPTDCPGWREAWPGAFAGEVQDRILERYFQDPILDLARGAAEHGGRRRPHHMPAPMTASSLVNDANGLNKQQQQALEKAKEQLRLAINKDSKVSDRDMYDLLLKQASVHNL